MNKAAFNYLNITNWHNNNYKGKGLKIAVMDLDTDIENTHLKGRVVGINGYGKKIGMHDGKVNHHGIHSCDIILQILPEAKVFLMSTSYNNLKWCIDNKIDILSISMSGHSNSFRELSSIATKQGVYIIAGAGNWGVDGIRFPAKDYDVIAVGACKLVNGKPVRASYSSIGDEKEVMSLTNMTVTTADNKLRVYGGTSCATPMFAGMIGLMINKVGKIPKESMRKIIYKYCYDIEEEGYDKNTGFGLFRLPNSNQIG